jgi:hypothetical protein
MHGSSAVHFVANAHCRDSYPLLLHEVNWSGELDDIEDLEFLDDEDDKLAALNLKCRFFLILLSPHRIFGTELSKLI